MTQIYLAETNMLLTYLLFVRIPCFYITVFLFLHINFLIGQLYQWNYFFNYATKYLFVSNENSSSYCDKVAPSHNIIVDNRREQHVRLINDCVKFNFMLITTSYLIILG